MNRLANIIVFVFLVWIAWAMVFSTVRAYEMIETECPEIFCVDSTPYWLKMSWRYWIVQTEPLRPK